MYKRLGIFILTATCAAMVAGCRGEKIETYKVAKQPSTQPAKEPGEPHAGMPSPEQMAKMAEAMAKGAVPPAMQGLAQNGQGLPEGHMSSPAIAKPSWAIPSGWTEKPGSKIRVGSFVVQGAAEGRQAEISVVPLPGAAGGKLANINLWRSQLGLDPVETEASAQEIEAGQNKMTLVDVTSNENLVDGKYKARLIAAIHPREQETWFFKITGDEETVGANREAFINFLNGTRFNDK